MHTQCPRCGTRLQVRADQLQAAGGQGRCARCGTVFDARSSLLEPEREAHVRPGARESATPGQAASAGTGAARVPLVQSHEGGGVWLLLGPAGLAARNLLRHRRRTLFGLLAVVFGVIALLLAGGFMEWVFWAMRESYIQSRLGHIQIAREGYFDRGTADPFAYLLPEDPAIRPGLERVPGVVATTPRLAFTGLASRGETTVSFVGEGVDPENEAAVSRQLTIEQGESLSSSDPMGIIVGAGLAENMGVVPGETVVLLATAQSGGLTAVEARVRGIFRTSTKAFDDTVLRVPIGMARSLMRVASAHTWVLLLDRTERTDEALPAVRVWLAQNTGAGLEARPWHAMADFYQKTVDLFTRQINVVRLMIAVIIIVSITNTLIMGILERTAEIGTLMALGQRRQQILRLFVTEGAFLGVIGGTAGLLLGWLLAIVVSTLGIPMPPPPGMDVAFVGEIRVTGPLAAGAFVIALLATVAASVYPAWRASRLRIVDALRQAR